MSTLDFSVFIIDDNEADRYLLKRDLRSINFTGHIFEAENGKEAIDFMSEYDQGKIAHGDLFPPVLIFLDVNMPIMNGFEFLELFGALKRNDSRYTSVVVMMFTTSEQEEDINQSNQYEFVQKYMIKGRYELDDLAKLLKQKTSE